MQHRKTKLTVTKLNPEFADCVPFQLVLSIFIIQQLFTLLFILTFVHNDCNPPTLRNCVSVPVHLQPPGDDITLTKVAAIVKKLY